MKALSEALSDRQDDLRELNNKYLDARLACLEDKLRSESAHQKEMRESESKRLDAIRENDRSTLTATTAQSQASIQALATAATTTAEVLRNNTERVVSPILDRLTSIETTVNRGIGRSAVADPQLSELMAEMRKLSTSRDVGAGKSEGLDKSWAIVLAVIGLLFLYLNYQNRTAPAVVAPAPPITFVMPSPGVTTTTTQPVPQPLVPR